MVRISRRTVWIYAVPPLSGDNAFSPKAFRFFLWESHDGLSLQFAILNCFNFLYTFYISSTCFRVMTQWQMPGEFFRNSEFCYLAFHLMKQWSLIISPSNWIRKDCLLTLKLWAHKFQVFWYLSSTLGRWHGVRNWYYLEETYISGTALLFAYTLWEVALGTLWKKLWHANWLLGYY